MKKLKRTKSLLAILLTLCICATLPIATVFAEDENDSVDVMALPGGDLLQWKQLLETIIPIPM